MTFQEQTAMKEVEHSQKYRAKRTTPKTIIRVVETSSKSIVGKLINISETGMKLLMDDSILVDQEIELSLAINNRNGDKYYIDVVSELVWLNKIPNSENVEAGFQIKCVNFKSKFRLKTAISMFNQMNIE